LKQLKKTKNYKHEYDPISLMLSDTVQEIINVGQMGNRKQKTEIDRINDEEKNWTLTSKGYYLDKEGKTHCPICKEEIKVENGCINCQNPECGWS
jgi:hypothetical protein